MSRSRRMEVPPWPDGWSQRGAWVRWYPSLPCAPISAPLPPQTKLQEAENLRLAWEAGYMPLTGSELGSPTAYRTQDIKFRWIRDLDVKSLKHLYKET